MSTFLILIITAVVGIALFDFVYYLPRFKDIEEHEERFYL